MSACTEQGVDSAAKILQIWIQIGMVEVLRILSSRSEHGVSGPAYSAGTFD